MVYSTYQVLIILLAGMLEDLRVGVSRSILYRSLFGQHHLSGI
jgi:hypothetical protein